MLFVGVYKRLQIVILQFYKLQLELVIVFTNVSAYSLSSVMSQENPLYKADRCHCFCCDLTKDQLTEHIPTGCVDYVSIIFVLSAIHPNKMPAALNNVYSVSVVVPSELILFSTLKCGM